MNSRYSVILGFMGQLTDRFSTYHEPRGLEEKVALAATIEGVRGIEPVYPFDFRDMDYDSFRSLISQHELQVSSLNVNIKTESKFHHGALTSIDPGIRAEAIEYIKRGMDWAYELGASCVTVCPLSDGHDYPFEINYSQAWRWLVECFQIAADYRPDVRLAIEYKLSEPRAKVIVPSGGIVLLLCEQIDRPNVGMTIDTGHALYVSESPAQMISLAADAGRLYLIHINDNYRNWDWDLMPGTVNYWDWLEILFWLEEVKYDGWLVSDVFPARTDPVETLSASYRSIQYGQDFLEAFGKDRLRDLIQNRQVIQVFDELQQQMLGRRQPQ